SSLLRILAVPSPPLLPLFPYTTLFRSRVTNDTSGCFEIVELQLIVHDVPDETADISPYMICELDTDGLALFDLTTKIPEILGTLDRKSTRLNSSHVKISYAVFCLKKKI